MTNTKIRYFISVFLLLSIVSASFAKPKQKIDKKQMAAQVKSEFLHAWNG